MAATSIALCCVVLPRQLLMDVGVGWDCLRAVEKWGMKSLAQHAHDVVAREVVTNRPVETFLLSPEPHSIFSEHIAPILMVVDDGGFVYRGCIFHFCPLWHNVVTHVMLA
ncbi:hypothetical protein QVD17_02299 [Tagetes erecta]|uniref:Secreted protein n=1 Tax=Tagetes erecta TaxID=13708 RepID=A0AAD8P7M9_TARER|nr:hypothetical protein QVD17_02299 [Tagetes erecta]